MIYLSAFIYVHYEHEKIQLLKQQIKDHPRQEVYTVESCCQTLYASSPINKNYQSGLIIMKNYRK